MLIRIVLLILGLLTAAPLAYAFLNDDGAVGLYALPGVILLAIGIVFKPELDWAYYKRYPRDLDQEIVRLLETKQPSWYARLDMAQRRELRQRTFMTQLGLDFKPQGEEGEALPADIEALIAAQAARLSMRLSPKQYVPGAFENIVVYKNPFPSPQHPDRFHASELYAPDGVIMLSLHQALPACLHPEEYFNISLYEFARAFEYANQGLWPAPPEVPQYDRLLRLTLGRDHTWVQQAVGLDEIDDLAVAVVLWMDFPEAFAKTVPALNDQLTRRIEDV